MGGPVALLMCAWLGYHRVAAWTDPIDRGVVPSIDAVTRASVARRTVDMTCEPADWAPGAGAHTFTITSADGFGQYSVSVRCQKPVWYYALDVKYYAPVDGKIYVSDMCIYHDGKVVNQTVSEILTRAGLQSVAHTATVQEHHALAALQREAHQRHRAALLADEVDVTETHTGAPRVKHITPLQKMHRALSAYQRSGRRPTLQSIGDFFSGLAAHVACSGVGVAGFDILLSGAAYTAGFCGGGSPIDPATIRALQQAQADTKAALDAQLVATRNVYNALNTFASQVRDLAENQALINAGVQDQLQTANERTTVAFAQGAAALQGVATLSTYAANRFAQLTQSQARTLDLVAANSNLIADVAASASADIKAAFAYTTNISYQLSNQTEALRQDMVVAIGELVARDFTQQAQIRALSASVYRLGARFQERRAHTNAILGFVATALAQDTVPWMRDTGLAAPLAASLDFEVSRLRIRYFRAGADVKLHEDTVSIHCAAGFAIDVLGTSSASSDVLTAVGPDGCEPGASCNCYWEWSQLQECDPRPELYPNGGALGAADPWFFRNPTSPFRTEYAINNTWCLGVSAPLAYITGSTRTLTNASAIVDMFRFLGSAAVDLGDDTYHVSELYTSTHGSAAYDAALASVSFLGLTRSTNLRDLAMVVSAIVNNGVDAFPYLPDALSRLIDGVLPTDTHTTDQTFTQVRGSIASCSQASFMAYSPEYVPVYNMYPVRAVATATINLTNLADNTWTLVQPLSVDLSSAMLPAMPGPTLVVGNPLGDSLHRIYNVNQNSICTAPVAAGCKNMIGYPNCLTDNALGECTPAEWYNRTAQGELFEPRAGTNVASLYRQTMVADVNGIYRCASLNQVGDPASMCALRARNDVTSGTLDGVSGTLVAISPRDSGRFVVSAELPVGPIANVIVSDCPVAYATDVTASGIVLNLQNTLMTDVVVTLFFRSDCCTPVPDPMVGVSVAASSTLRIPVPPCISASGECRQLYVDAFRATSGDVCANIQAFNLTTPTVQQVARGFGSVDPSYVTRTVATAVDATALANANLMLTVFETQQMILARQIRLEKLLGLTTQDFGNAPTYEQIIQSANNTAGNATKGAADLRGISFEDFTSLAAYVSAQSASFATRFADLTAQGEAQRAEALRQNSIFDSKLLALNDTVALVRNVTDVALAVQNATNAALNGLLGGLVDAIITLNENPRGSVNLGSFASLFDEAIDGIVDTAEDAADLGRKVPGLARAIATFAEDQIEEAFGKIVSPFGSVAQTIAMVIVIVISTIAFLVVLGLVYVFHKQIFRNCCKGKGSHSYESASTTEL